MITKHRLLRFFHQLISGRFSAFFIILALYLVLCLVIRIAFLLWSCKNAELNIIYMIRAFFTGFFFDLIMGLFYLSPYAIYLFLLPRRFTGSLPDRAIIYFYFSVLFIIMYFSLLAEIPFWDEFGVRFNFIAVDYLIYTYEVVENINQSYPLPLIVLVLAGLVVLTFILLIRSGIFRRTFNDKISLAKRSFYFIPVVMATVILGILLKNKQADFSNNLVINELGKNGAFSFISAFRANELDYATFYPKLLIKKHSHGSKKICYRKTNGILQRILMIFQDSPKAV